MKINASIILGPIFLILLIFDPTDLVSFSLGITGILFIISSIFEIKKYNNKNLYIALTAVLLVILWVFVYIQVFTPTYQPQTWLYYLIAGFFTLGIICIAMGFLEEGTIVKRSKNHSKFYINPKAIILGLLIGIIAYLIANDVLKQYSSVISGLSTFIVVGRMTKDDREYWVSGGIAIVLIIVVIIYFNL